MSSISQAIQQVRQGPGEDPTRSVSGTFADKLTADQDEDTFTQLVERYLRSEDAALRRAVLEALLEVLDDADEDRRVRFRLLSDFPVQLLSVTQRQILEDTSLTYIPLVLPLHADSPDGVEFLLARISRYGRPREVVLALNEAIGGIEELVGGFVISDDEEELGEKDEEVRGDALHARLCLVLRSYTTGESL